MIGSRPVSTRGTKKGVGCRDALVKKRENVHALHMICTTAPSYFCNLKFITNFTMSRPLKQLKYLSNPIIVQVTLFPTLSLFTHNSNNVIYQLSNTLFLLINFKYQLIYIQTFQNTNTVAHLNCCLQNIGTYIPTILVY